MSGVVVDPSLFSLPGSCSGSAKRGDEREHELRSEKVRSLNDVLLS